MTAYARVAPSTVQSRGRGLAASTCATPHLVPLVGSVPSYTLHGSICVVTGASRGVGRGIALELAAAGCIVYVTGRSTSSRQTEVLLQGSVDATASAATRRGGAGIAAYIDHTLDDESKQFVHLLSELHGRLDLLVNNAFLMPKPDMLFFSAPVWQQPCRLLDEQFCIGARNHVVLTLLSRDLLSKARGCVVNVSSGGSQGNTQVFPVAYHVNKAAYDRMVLALACQLQNCSISVLTLWPGSVATERMVVGKRRFQGWLTDPETTLFSGRAVVKLGELSAEARLRLSGRTLTTVEVLYMSGGFDVDGYRHDLQREASFAIAQYFSEAPNMMRVVN
ncbi:Dhrs1 [Symbiodinium sp. CCMP2456]|nr:Dhrs1 [Symbiodinium sp. CCMP2456]